MKVRILEDRISDTDADTGRHYLVEKDDVITVPDALGARWCSYGWASDVAEQVPTGLRVAGARELNVHDSTITG